MTISRPVSCAAPPAACLALAGIAGPLVVPAARASDRDVVDLLSARGGFDRFLTLCHRANVADELKGAGPFTVFAPNDAAFGRIPESLVIDLAGSTGEAVPDMVRLRARVLLQIVQGRHSSAGWTNIQEWQTLNGVRLKVEMPQGEPMRVLNAHIVEGLHPLSEFGSRTVTLTTQNGNRNLVDGSDTNRVSVRLPRDGGCGPGSALAFWVAATIVRADIPASNGIIHVVDRPARP